MLDAVDRRLADVDRRIADLLALLADVDRRIADLLTLRGSLRQLQSEGAILPRDDVLGEHCVCYLLKAYRDTGQGTSQEGEFFDD
ncbi:MAG: hypothetical protein HZB20_03275 [Chloroflexi bacterium]|nr:hypothetical protein [Chloroflexota bacterium]